MTTIETITTTVERPGVGFKVDDARPAAVSFLARYSGRTLEAYRHDLRGYYQWASNNDVDVLKATRPHIELFRAWMYGRPHAALAVLLGLNGLRVSKACATNVEDLGFERGHRTLRIIGKGNKPATIPLVPRTARTIRPGGRRTP